MESHYLAVVTSLGQGRLGTVRGQVSGQVTTVEAPDLPGPGVGLTSTTTSRPPGLTSDLTSPRASHSHGLPALPLPHHGLELHLLPHRQGPEPAHQDAALVDKYVSAGYQVGAGAGAGGGRDCTGAGGNRGCGFHRNGCVGCGGGWAGGGGGGCVITRFYQIDKTPSFGAVEPLADSRIPFPVMTFTG